MAAPGHRLGAHQRHSFFSSNSFHLSDNLLELRGQHKIGVGAKRRDLPTRIRRVRRWLSKTAEIASPDIVNLLALERGSQCFPVKVRIASRRGPAPDIDKKLDAMRF